MWAILAFTSEGYVLHANGEERERERGSKHASGREGREAQWDSRLRSRAIPPRPAATPAERTGNERKLFSCIFDAARNGRIRAHVRVIVTTIRQGTSETDFAVNASPSNIRDADC